MSRQSEVRRLLGERRDGPGRSDVSYRVYAGIMLALTAAAPVLRIAILWTAGVLPAAGGVPVPAVAAILTLVTALCVLAGAQTGPARADLPRIDLLLTAPFRRSRLLVGAAGRGFALSAALSMLGAAVLGAARLLRGELDPLLGISLILGAAGLGLLVAFGMLVGQLGKRVRAIVASALLVLALAQLGIGLGALADPGAASGGGPWFVPGRAVDPWSGYAAVLLSTASEMGDSAALFGSVGAPSAVLWHAAPALVGGVVAAACAPWVLGRLRWEGLREQSVRWDAVSTLAITGDSRAAAARLGAPVRVGRRWRWSPAGRPWRIIVARDLLGIARTPARSLAAAATLLASGVALGLATLSGGNGDGGGSAGVAGGAPTVDPQFAFALGGILGLAIHSGIVPLCRGLRAAAEGVGSSPVLPLSPGALLQRHLAVPGVLGGALLAAGAALAVALSAASGSPLDPSRLGGLGAAVIAMASTALLLRLLTALKGPLPQRLLAPVPTPVGDLSGMNVLLWAFDGPILAVLAGGALGVMWVSAAGSAPFAAVAGSLLLVLALALWARLRLAASRA